MKLMRMRAASSFQIFGIVLLVVGVEYYGKCVGNDAALFLVVAGTIMICMALATFVAHVAKV